MEGGGLFDPVGPGDEKPQQLGPCATDSRCRVTSQARSPHNKRRLVAVASVPIGRIASCPAPGMQGRWTATQSRSTCIGKESWTCRRRAVLNATEW